MTTAPATKCCPKCQKDLPTSKFHQNKAKKDGLAHTCKDCFRSYSKRYYEEHKAETFARNQRTRRRQKLKLLELKAQSPCTDCGNKFHPFIMEFDHTDPSNKLFPVGRAGGRSGTQISKEMEKCELVCANCHKMRTFRRHQLRPNHVLAGVE